MVGNPILFIIGPPSPLPRLCKGPGNLMKSRKSGKGYLVSFHWEDHWYTCLLLWGQSALWHLCQSLKAETLPSVEPWWLGYRLPHSWWHHALCSFANIHSCCKGVRHELLILTQPPNIFPFEIQGTYFSQGLLPWFSLPLKESYVISI